MKAVLYTAFVDFILIVKEGVAPSSGGLLGRILLLIPMMYGIPAMHVPKQRVESPLHLCKGNHQNQL
jgi:hypothetical protein